MKKTILLVILLLFIKIAYSDNVFSSPLWPVRDNIIVEKVPAVQSPVSIYLKLLFNYYHYGISPNDFSACPFNPTCSYFAKQSVEKFGFLGIFIAADRLMRDNFWSSLGDYPTINGKLIDKPSWHYLPYYRRLNEKNINFVIPYN